MTNDGTSHHTRQPAIRRRSVALLPLALGCAMLGSGIGRASAAILPTPASLASALAAALRAGQPLVVLASLDGCPFCRMVRDSYLAPLQRDTGLPVVQLDLASRQAVLDFDAATHTHDQLLRHWGVGVAPTVLFFGQGGREVAPRLVGASIPDFYGAYLEQRLEAARRSLG
jgi:hypothetical protein